MVAPQPDPIGRRIDAIAILSYIATPSACAARGPRRPRRARRRFERAASQDPGTRAAPRSRATTPPLRGLRLLIVEDHGDTAQMLRQMLGALGAEVQLAENGRDALEQLVATATVARPDLILCDLLMPEMDGLTFARRVRDHPAWRDIPIVAVTALGDNTDYLHTWTEGFQAHLVKPVNAQVLAQVVRRFAGGRQPCGDA